jgi:hypothetical protein
MLAIGITIFSIITEVSFAVFILRRVKNKFFSLNCILQQLFIDEPLIGHTILDSSVFFQAKEIIDIYDKRGEKKPAKSRESLKQQRARARKR